MSEVVIKKGTETLASLVYTRNKDGQVTKATTKGLPGEEKPAFSYDENSRLTKGAGTKYAYDGADNPTTIGEDTYAYNSADELEKEALKTTTVTTYTCNEAGERTKASPASGPATSYGYDQAGNLTTVTRPKEGTTPTIEDTYAYNGEGLRTSQDISGTTTYLAWDGTEGLPLILNDGTNSYIYGPGGLPVEQISSGGTVTYLHHDQQGSTRLLTGSTGTVAGKCTYGAYGSPTCEGTTTTPLGYDAQYTNADTGLIYMRARTYDPVTAQFLSGDPLAPITGAAYNYADDDPMNTVDPTGLCSINPFSSSSCLSDAAGGVKDGLEAGAGAVKEGAKSVAGFVYEHPVILPAVGCTVGMLAGPEVCVAAVGTSVGLSTAKNAVAYTNGELSGEQVFYKQLLDTGLSGLGAAPGLPLLGTAAGGLVDTASVGVQLLVSSSLEFPDAVLGSLESNISCALLGTA